ncbi:GNAT family N-acetyltransferase [Paenibacillus ginsengarvi]|uniref:GNAT family N-acetyltransferase n=1 Tax=Paenibacillus ginsengarvi TaxID=400777 RepID=A0A3B0BDM0_9BACL|nr:GNAT family N-acetyltransferase [Paenibacillus ginsengarvi]RKN71213.1 GNAT family N-acetyltransferase [Paenibacillus ginsengarvi]
MGVRFRPYVEENDYTVLRELIRQKFADPERRFYPSLGDWDYNRAFGGDAFRNQVTVCELEDGTTIGAIWPGHYRILYVFTGPEYAHLENEIFAWAEKRYCGPSLEDRSGQEVYVWAYLEDRIRAPILRDRGYTPHTWYMYSGVINLEQAIPEPNFPAGYSVRPIQPGDLPQKVAIMAGSAGLTKPTLDIYNRLMSGLTYHQELDLVVVDEAEQVVGFANVWHDTANRIAIIEPFGTAKTHRRRGLATNLLYEAMHRLKERGVTQLYINHGGLWTLDREPDDAMRVYTRVGFRELGNMFVWCKSCSQVD